MSRTGSDRINGFYKQLINGVYWGYNPLILTIGPNFRDPGHPRYPKLEGSLGANLPGARKKTCQPLPKGILEDLAGQPLTKGGYRAVVWAIPQFCISLLLPFPTILHLCSQI